ncbi:hypothetical protein BN2497_10099 [Janthinobacterium sp. CG23_2]|nr:hypothetical protein BN2497_10099 [Janthinobacterium sp. CG23_2]CUU31447.1 hypothetical protein BN3177_10099 [Janthinobacterium sp. CG23_2]
MCRFDCMIIIIYRFHFRCTPAPEMRGTRYADAVPTAGTMLSAHRCLAAAAGGFHNAQTQFSRLRRQRPSSRMQDTLILTCAESDT